MPTSAAVLIVATVPETDAERHARREHETARYRLISTHRDVYETVERPDFLRARRYYQGKFFDVSDDRSSADRQASMLTSKNIIYAIVDTAMSAMVGSNPRVASDPRNDLAEQARYSVDGLLGWVFDSNQIRSVAALTLMDATLNKRGIFKTTWSTEMDAPCITAIEPSRLFFDPEARLPQQAQYWIEATVITEAEFTRRVASGLYAHPEIRKAVPSEYPTWLGTTDGASSGGDWKAKLRNARRWVLVYEIYDKATRKVEHYVDGVGIVMCDDLLYIPYSMYSLNHTGEDLFGMSEVQLVLSQQESINDLLTLMKQVVYRLIPRMMYDASVINADNLAKMLSGEPGAFVPLETTNSERGRNLDAFFSQMPVPQNYDAVPQFIDRLEQGMAQTTALAEMSRGQIAGARTATEIALVDMQMKNRLATRDGHFGSALEDVAAKCLFLAQRYMRGPKQVQVTGRPGWSTVDLATIHDIQADFRLVAHNPIKNNPAVLGELLINLYPVLSQSPSINVAALDRAILDALGLPESIAKSDAEMQAEAEAAAQAPAAGPDLGAMLAGAGPKPVPGMPPDAMDPLQAALMAQTDGAEPAPDGAQPAPGAQTVIEDLDLDQETLDLIFNS